MDTIKHIDSARKVDTEYTIAQNRMDSLDAIQQLFVTARDGAQETMARYERSYCYDLMTRKQLEYWFASTGNMAYFGTLQYNCTEMVGQILSQLYEQKAIPEIGMEYADIGDLLGCYIHPAGLMIINPIFLFQYPEIIHNITVPHELTHAILANQMIPIFSHGETFDNKWQEIFGKVPTFKNAKFTGASRARILSNLQFTLNKYCAEGYHVSIDD